MNSAGFCHPLGMSPGNVSENEDLGLTHQQGQQARYVNDFVMDSDYFNPYRSSENESPDRIHQQRQQAQHLIDFLRCLPRNIRAKVPRLNENVMAQADGISIRADIIRVWMSHSKEIQTLRCLDLTGSNLTNLPPEIGLFRNLRRLFLSNNQLTVLPAEIGNLRALIELDLGNNQLTALPAAIGNLGTLLTLDLRNNQFVAFPAVIGNLRTLSGLYLCNNQLAALPAAIGNLRALLTLDLRNNQLAALPAAIRNLRILIALHLRNNQLAALPAEIGSLRALVELDLRNNQLAALPVEIEHLAALRNLFLRDNRFVNSPPEIEHLMALRCDLPRLQISPLCAWSSEFERAFPQREPINTAYWGSRTMDFTPLESLPVEENQSFTNYLTRLRKTQDYRSGGASRKNVILRVERMVQLACKNPEFKHLMLAAIAEGLGSCGDRVLIAFNEIEIQWQFHHKKMTDNEFKSLAIRASRYRCLEQYAKQICLRLGFRDEIETILFYQIQLREALNLPITTEGMLYPRTSGVTLEMLKAAQAHMESLSDEYLLSKSDYWQARMAIQHSDLAEEVALKYGTLLETVEEYYHCDAEKRDDWLNAHDDPELREILKEPNYDAAAKFVMGKRAIALSKLYREPSGFVNLEGHHSGPPNSQNLTVRSIGTSAAAAQE